MPYPNEHAARVLDPGDFEADSMRSKELPNGVRLIIGKLKDGKDAMETQAYRFPVDKFTPEEARAWLKDHDIKFISFEKAVEEKKVDDFVALMDKVRAKLIEADAMTSPAPSPAYPSECWVITLGDAEAIVHYGDGNWRVPFKLDAAGEPTLAPREKWMPVKQEWVEAKSLDDTLVFGGTEVKALGSGRVGGYLVRFSTANDPDIEGDFFTAATDFGPHKTTLTFYEHGLDESMKRRVLDDRASLKADEFGIWVEAQLALRDAYEKFLYQMAEKGRIGWSSATAAHLVERQREGKSQRITRWPLGLDASLTLVPAEPRATAIALKSLIERHPDIRTGLKALQEGEEPKAGATTGTIAPGEASVVTVPVVLKHVEDAALKSKGDNPMTPEELAKIEERFGSLETAQKSTGKTIDEIAAMLKKQAESAAGFQAEEEKVAPAPVFPRPFKSAGEQLKAIAKYFLTRDMDQRLVTITDYAMKALGSNEALPSEGGFLMQPDFSGEVLKKAYDNSVLASRVRKIPISSASNGIRINAIDETSRVAGSRWGGVQAYWLAEATAPTASKPKFRQLDLKLEKLAILMYATEEVLQDSSALNAIFMEAGAEEIAFMTDKSIFDGAGAGMPLGMLASLARIDVAKETGQVAATVVAENVVKMWSRMWAPSRPSSIWLINQDVEPFLDLMAVTVGLGGYPVYMPPGGIADAPYGRLKGRPVILFENSSTVGTLGDIMLVDPQQYLLADKGGPDFQSSIHVAFTTDEIAFRLIYRVDGEPIWNSALTPAKGTNTLSPYVALAARA